MCTRPAPSDLWCGCVVTFMQGHEGAHQHEVQRQGDTQLVCDCGRPYSGPNSSAITLPTIQLLLCSPKLLR
jgi:hypothetical protein